MSPFIRAMQSSNGSDKIYLKWLVLVRAIKPKGFDQKNTKWQSLVWPHHWLVDRGWGVKQCCHCTPSVTISLARLVDAITNRSSCNGLSLINTISSSSIAIGSSFSIDSSQIFLFNDNWSVDLWNWEGTQGTTARRLSIGLMSNVLLLTNIDAIFFYFL